jgi:predicted CopG family antitoxin
MATKTITITEDAYERLKARKRDGESFTETIIRITDGEREVMDGFGAMCDVEGFRTAVEETRAELDDDLRVRGER